MRAFLVTSDFIFDAIPLALGTVGGIVLIVAPFTPRTKAAGSRLFRTAVLFAGITTATWGVFGLLDKPSHSHLSKHGHYLLHHYKDMCSGASLSVLLILIVSGELWVVIRRDRQLRRDASNDRSNIA
jgi:hypothetical protein